MLQFIDCTQMFGNLSRLSPAHTVGTIEKITFHGRPEDFRGIGNGIEITVQIMLNRAIQESLPNGQRLKLSQRILLDDTGSESMRRMASTRLK
ncbi:MAG TPA: hypothetical protein PKY22_03090 [Accumulibacter sp.]|nr:hypothetical protein [Accumulibacter sp.]